MMEEILEKYSPETIDEVANITDEEAAYNNKNRARMIHSMVILENFIKPLIGQQRTGDTNRSIYPEFWEVWDKISILSNACGIISGTGIIRNFHKD